jgi:hypothetical protein
VVLGDQLSVTEWAVPLTPVPDALTEFGESAALLVIVTFPLTLPVVFGAKITFKTADWPAAIVAPDSPPPTLKPVPLTEIPDTVTLEFPVFFTVTPSSLLAPSASLPKFSVELDKERFLVTVAPVPLMLMVSVGSLPLFLMTMLPVTLPVLVGANVMVRFIVTPGPSQSGIYKLLMLNPLPLSVAPDRTSVEPPLFLSWMSWELFVPNGTEPKFALVAVAESAPNVVPFTKLGETVEQKRISRSPAMNLARPMKIDLSRRLVKRSSWENAEKLGSNELARGP